MTEFSPEMEEQALSILQRFKGDYRLQGKLSDVFKGGNNNKMISRFLWEQSRKHNIHLGEYNDLWYFLCYVPDAYDGDDVIRLLKSINKYFPAGVKTHDHNYTTLIYDDGAVPGAFYGYQDIIGHKKDDADFAETLRDAWQDLPAPFNIATGYFLAYYGMMPYTELTEEIGDKLAFIRLKYHTSDHNSWLEHNPYPPDIWKQHLRKVALSTKDFYYRRPAALTEFLDALTSPQEILAALQRLCPTDDGLFKFYDVMEKIPSETFDALEEKLRKQSLPLPAYDRYAAWPHLHEMMLYLHLCKRLSHTPAADLDPFFKAALEHFTIDWYGEVAAFLKASLPILNVIPQERLEALLLSFSSPRWELLSLCPRPTILSYITEQIKAFPTSSYNTDTVVNRLMKDGDYRHPDGLLGSLRQALLPYANQALKEAPCPQRKVFVNLLAHSENIEALEGLLHALQDDTKTIREMAIGGLARLPAKDVVPAIAPLLSAKKKDIRQAAAQILFQLPATQEGIQLAQAHLDKEKVKDIRATLEQIASSKPLDSSSSQGSENIDAALLENDGERWQEFIEQPEALLESFWRIIQKICKNELIYSWRPAGKHWLAMLERLAPQSLRYALLSLPAFPSYEGGTLLNLYRNDLPALTEEITALLRADAYQRPAAMGKATNSPFDKESLLSWCKGYALEHSLPIFLEGLRDKGKKIRKVAIEGITEFGEKAIPSILPLLNEVKPDVRCEIIALLDHFATPEALAALKTLQQDDKQPAAVKEAVDTVLAKHQAQSLDIAAFPDTPEGSQQLDQALAALPATPYPKAIEDATPLPSLRWKTGEHLSHKAQRWFVSTLLQESREKRSAQLQALRPRLDDQSCYALSEAIVNAAGFFDRGYPLYAQAVIGSPEQIDAIAAKLESLASSSSTAWGEDGCEALARNGSPAAIRHLDHAMRKGKANALKRRATTAIHRLAQERAQSLEELIDSAISPLGFAMDGTLQLSYGSRSFLARLLPDLSLTLQDASGKEISNLPAVKKDDDATLAEASKKLLADAKKQLKAFASNQKARLEAALRSDRRWDIATWQARFLQHPLFFNAARSLLWEALDQKEKTLARFLITHDLQLLQANQKPFKLPKNGQIRLLHPIDLNDKEKQAWQAQLDALNLQPPFPQLQRPTFALSDLPQDDKSWLVHLPAVGSMSFNNALQKLNYERGSREDAGLIFSSSTQLGEYSIAFSHGGWSPEWMEDSAGVDLQSISAYHNGQSIPWRTLPPRLISEIIHDAKRLTAAGTK